MSDTVNNLENNNNKPKRISTAIRKKNMLAALRSTLGIVSAAADAAGISRVQHYNWLKKDAKYRAAVEDIAERALDFSEAALLKNIEAGKEASIFFHLKTKGKHRGYIETTHNLNTDIPKSDLEDMTNEELLAIINRKI